MRILVVDDNKDITEAISFYCQSEDISYKVINQGKKALDIIQREKFDLTLLDLAMPEFSGLDVIKWLNEEGILESNNVVIFTAMCTNALVIITPAINPPIWAVNAMGSELIEPITANTICSNNQ